MAPSSTTQSAPSRLPSTRERRPALIALAIVLIVGGALASGWLALQSGDRAYFLQVSQDVAQGEDLTPEKLQRVSLPEGFDGGVPVGREDEVVGSPAATRLIAEDASQVSVPVTAGALKFRSGDQVALDIGSTDGNRTSVLAEVVSEPTETGDGGFGAASASQMIVSVHLSCLSQVSQGVEDSSIVVARVGTVDESLVRRTCGA
jgi:hypothetical protein